MSAVKVGQIVVALREPPANTGQLSCGHVVLDVGYAGAYRFASELTKIREALLAAHAVLTERTIGKTTPAEARLASLLVDLEITP
jgi:hypothetical protein